MHAEWVEEGDTTPRIAKTKQTVRKGDACPGRKTTTTIAVRFDIGNMKRIRTLVTLIFAGLPLLFFLWRYLDGRVDLWVLGVAVLSCVGLVLFRVPRNPTHTGTTQILVVFLLGSACLATVSWGSEWMYLGVLLYVVTIVAALSLTRTRKRSGR